MIPVIDIHGTRHYINVDCIVTMADRGNDEWLVSMLGGFSVTLSDQAVGELVNMFNGVCSDDDQCEGYANEWNRTDRHAVHGIG